MNELEGTVVFRRNIYMDLLIRNGGLLPDDIAAHACWSYCRGAHNLLHEIDKGAVYADEDDRNYDALSTFARQVATWYGYDNPNPYWGYIGQCRLQAKALGLTFDERVAKAMELKGQLNGKVR